MKTLITEIKEALDRYKWLKYELFLSIVTQIAIIWLVTLRISDGKEVDALKERNAALTKRTDQLVGDSTYTARLFMGAKIYPPCDMPLVR